MRASGIDVMSDDDSAPSATVTTVPSARAGAR